MDYSRPILLKDTTKYPKLYFVMNMSSKCDGGFKYNAGSQSVEHNMANIIMKVSLTLAPNGTHYDMNDQDKTQLDAFIENISKPKTVPKRTQTS